MAWGCQQSPTCPDGFWGLQTEYSNNLLAFATVIGGRIGLCDLRQRLFGICFEVYGPWVVRTVYLVVEKLITASRMKGALFCVE